MLLNEKAAALQEEVDDLLMIPLDLPTPLKTEELTWVYLFQRGFILFVNFMFLLSDLFDMHILLK